MHHLFLSFLSFLFLPWVRLVGSYFPNQGSSLQSPAVKVRILATGPPGNSQLVHFLMHSIIWPLVGLHFLGLEPAHLWLHKQLQFTHLLSEKAMAPNSSTLAWKIPWTEEPGRLQSTGSLSQTRLSDLTFTFHFHALEKEMATHSSVLAWRIPGTVEPGGLPSMGSHRVGHDWSNLAEAAASPAPGFARSNQFHVLSSSPSALIYTVTVTTFFSSMLRDKTETSKWEQLKLPFMTSLSPRHIATSVGLWKHTSGPPGYSTSFPQWSCQKRESLPLASTLFLFYLFITLAELCLSWSMRTPGYGMRTLSCSMGDLVPWAGTKPTHPCIGSSES